MNNILQMRKSAWREGLALAIYGLLALIGDVGFAPFTGELLCNMEGVTLKGAAEGSSILVRKTQEDAYYYVRGVIYDRNFRGPGKPNRIQIYFLNKDGEETRALIMDGWKPAKITEGVIRVNRSGEIVPRVEYLDGMKADGIKVESLEIRQLDPRYYWVRDGMRVIRQIALAIAVGLIILRFGQWICWSFLPAESDESIRRELERSNFHPSGKGLWEESWKKNTLEKMPNDFESYRLEQIVYSSSWGKNEIATTARLIYQHASEGRRLSVELKPELEGWRYMKHDLLEEGNKV